ncbi:hypothetical protein BHE97_17925 [Aeromicrobium sp. PE09-221]|uniref:hypothetical protein n=1 Tax=Aeromicrobium sp. PE09-221 TaxID=1898043 RepID=UPI000B3E90ED|nr:hypothetical protein [Aeromicrobium sp. PE09-221]OUZ07162.1 hypothetical protein BHE97_17925 [Aeromicrobium sp. PE09-221]
MSEGVSRGRWSWWATIVGVVLALVGTLLIAFGDRLAGASEPSGTASAVSVSQDFAVAYNTYDVADPDDYKGRLEGLLTDEYREQAFEVIDAIFEALAEKEQTSGDADVLAVGVPVIDDDSAETLVAVDATISNTDVEDAGVERHFRWKLSLVRDGGGWKVDGFESVASVEAEALPQGGESP